MLSSKHGRNYTAPPPPCFLKGKQEGSQGTSADTFKKAKDQGGGRWCLGQQIQSHSSIAEREGSCVADTAEVGASPKSLGGMVPEVPRATWDADSKQHYAHMSATPVHTPCRKEQSQLLLLHWAERCSSCRATKLPLASRQLEGACSKDKITTSLTLI